MRFIFTTSIKAHQNVNDFNHNAKMGAIANKANNCPLPSGVSFDNYTLINFQKGEAQKCAQNCTCAKTTQSQVKLLFYLAY